MGRTKVNDVFTQEDWDKYNKYAEMVKRDLSVSGLPKEKKEEIFNTLAYNEQMRMAVSRIGSELNAIADQRNALIIQYRAEPNDARAQKLSKEIEKLGNQHAALAKERNYFLQKFHETSPRAVKLDNEMTEALIKQGYKIDANGRPRKGEDYRQSPTVKTRTHTKKSQTR